MNELLKHYRIVLRDARGRFTKSLSKAQTYSIYFKSRVIKEKTKFSPRIKRVKDRSRFLAKLLGEFVRLQQRLIKKRQKLQKEKKLKLQKQKIAKQARQKAKETIDEDEKELKKTLKKSKSKISKEKPGKTRKERSKTRPARVLGDVFVTPIDTKSKEYKKEFIHKIVLSEPWKRKFKIRILDFTLSKSITVVKEKVSGMAHKLWKLFMPHLLHEWKKQKWHKEKSNIKNRMIFRLKYKIPIGKGRFLNSGISDTAFNDGKLEIFKETILAHLITLFNRFITEGYFERSGNSKILITGFTFELVEKDLGLWEP